MCFFELAATPKNKINKHNKIPPASRVFLRTSPMHTRFYSGAKTQDQGGLGCRLWRLPTRWHHKVLLQFSHSVSLSVHTADTEGTKRHISKLVVKKKKKDLGENHNTLTCQLNSPPFRPPLTLDHASTATNTYAEAKSRITDFWQQWKPYKALQGIYLNGPKVP